MHMTSLYHVGDFFPDFHCPFCFDDDGAPCLVSSSERLVALCEAGEKKLKKKDSDNG